MRIPTEDRANEMLAEAEALNPGPWAAHSRTTAENARYIAEKCAVSILQPPISWGCSTI